MELIEIAYPTASSLTGYTCLTISHLKGIDWYKTGRGMLLYDCKEILYKEMPLIICPKNKLLLLEWSNTSKLTSKPANFLAEGLIALCMPETGIVHNRSDIKVINGRIFNPEQVYGVLAEIDRELSRVRDLDIWQKIGIICEILITTPKVRHIIKLKKEE